MRRGKAKAKAAPIVPFNGPKAHRTLILTLVGLNGEVRLTKPLAHAMGLRRRQLRAKVALWVDDGDPVRLVGRNRVVQRDNRLRLTLLLDAEQVQTLISALRHARDASHTRQSVVEAAEILHRIAAELPPDLFARNAVIGGFDVLPMPVDDAGGPSNLTRNLIVAAIRAHQRVRILYTNADGAKTDRIVWPLTVSHHGSTLLAWCEQRQAFRHFRLASIAAPQTLSDPIPRSRPALLAEWRATLPAQSVPAAPAPGDPAA